MEYSFQTTKIRDLFSAFDDQPIEHQIELIEALGDFIYDWMRKHGLSSVELPDKSWKTHISMMVISQNHSCDVMSLFMQSKLFQKLIFMGSRQSSSIGNGGSPEYGKSQDDDPDNDADSISGRSSGTETMEYEDIDRLLVSIDSAVHVTDIMDPISSSRLQPGCKKSVVESPLSQLSECDGEKNTVKIQTRERRKYKKRKLMNTSCDQVANDENVVKPKKRIVQIVDTNPRDEAEPELVDDNGSMKFKCGVCGALFTRIWHLRRHALLHYGVKPHACNLCPMTFARADHLHKHIARHMGDRKVRSCTECDMVFRTVREIREHFKSQHRPPPVINSLEKSRTECEVCAKIFVNPKQLRAHVKRTHRVDQKPFMCAECGQRFTRQGHLDRHMRLHTGDKPFMCNRCACQFARADHLRRHLQAHLIEDGLANAASGVGCEAASVSTVDAVNKLSSNSCESPTESLDCKPVLDDLPFSMGPLPGGADNNHVCNHSRSSPDHDSQTDFCQKPTSTVA